MMPPRPVEGPTASLVAVPPSAFDKHKSGATQESGHAITDPLAVSIAQACTLCGISRAGLYRCIAAGQLPTRKLGSRTLIIVEELRTFLSNLPQGGRRHV